MSDINILETHSIRVIGRNASADALDECLAGLTAQIDARPEVTAAKAALDDAATKVEHLKARHASLNIRARDLNGRLTGTRDALRQALIATNKDIPDSTLSKIGNARAEYDGISEAIGVLVTEVIPAAEIAAEAAKIEYYDARAAAIADMLNGRAAQLIERLGPLADEEFVIDIDTLSLPVFLSLRTQRSRLINLASQGRESLKLRREHDAQAAKK